MERALERRENNYVTIEDKVLLLKDIGLEIYTVGKYVKKYKVYIVLFFFKSVDIGMNPSLPCI